MRLFRVYIIFMFMFILSCKANSKLNFDPEQYDFDTINIYVFAPQVNIYNVNKLESPLNLIENNTFSILSKEKYFVNTFLNMLRINKMEKCKRNQNFGYTHLLVEAVNNNKSIFFVSDKKTLYSIDRKLCVSVSEKLFEKLNLLN